MSKEEPPRIYRLNANTELKHTFWLQGSMAISAKIRPLQDEAFDIEVIAVTHADEDHGVVSPSVALEAVVRIADCICDWKRTEELEGDLRQLHHKRVVKNGKAYADVWVWCQLAPVVFDRLMDFVRKFYAARAGK